MSKPSLILIGAGGHARACIDVIEQHGQFQIAGLIGLSEEMQRYQFNYSVMATDKDLPILVKSYQYALIAVGQIQTPDFRVSLYQQATDLGFHFPLITSPFAKVSRQANIGAGTIVMPGAIVNAGARIGRNCIINTRALVEHDVTVADHCHISTGAILNGEVNVGAGSFIGSGSVIKEGVTIGQRCVIGMGLAVRHSLSDHAFFIGLDKA
jgi:sugar O-acyltransferase (sialic acid O-acetyltransferase NeuD family)